GAREDGLRAVFVTAATSSHLAWHRLNPEHLTSDGHSALIESLEAVGEQRRKLGRPRSIVVNGSFSQNRRPFIHGETELAHRSYFGRKAFDDPNTACKLQGIDESHAVEGTASH